MYSLIEIRDKFVVFESPFGTVYADKKNIASEIKETYLYSFINGKFVIETEKTKAKKAKSFNKLKSLIKN